MLKLGYNTAGTEAIFEEKLRDAIECRTTRPFRYVEIGIAEGTTLLSVAELLANAGIAEWQAVGIDLLDGPFFNERNFLKRTRAFNAHIEFDGRREPFVADRITCDVRVLLLGGEKRAMVSPDCINFCLIDGCHGAPCVEKDFLSIEKGIAKGGIVAFHDAMPEDQGNGYQQHCQQNINVLEAIRNLGLHYRSDKSCERQGWKFVGQAPGDKSRDGNGFMFFERI